MRTFASATSARFSAAVRASRGCAAASSSAAARDADLSAAAEAAAEAVRARSRSASSSVRAAARSFCRRATSAASLSRSRPPPPPWRLWRRMRHLDLPRASPSPPSPPRSCARLVAQPAPKALVRSPLASPPILPRRRDPRRRPIAPLARAMSPRVPVAQPQRFSPQVVQRRVSACSQTLPSCCIEALKFRLRIGRGSLGLGGGGGRDVRRPVCAGDPH